MSVVRPILQMMKQEVRQFPHGQTGSSRARLWTQIICILHYSKVYSVLYILRTFYSVLCALNSITCSLYYVLNTLLLYSVLYALNSLVCTLYYIFCTLYSICSLYTVLYTLCSVFCACYILHSVYTLYRLLYTLCVFCDLYSILCALVSSLYSIQYTLCSVYSL